MIKIKKKVKHYDSCLSCLSNDDVNEIGIGRDKSYTSFNLCIGCRAEMVDQILRGDKFKWDVHAQEDKKWFDLIGSSVNKEGYKK